MGHQTLRLAVFAGLLGVMACGDASGGNKAATVDSASASAPQASEAPAPAAAPTVDSAAADTNTNTDALTLRPGDVITWTPSPPHRVQFGGTVTSASGAQVTLTSFEDVSMILTDFQPALTADANGMAVAPTGAKVTARVRDDAAGAGVPSFFFTCGFPPHKGRMLTVDFTIAPASAETPARDVQIVSSNSPLAWILKTDQGDLPLTRP